MNKKWSTYGKNYYLFIEKKTFKKIYEFKSFAHWSKDLIKITIEKFKERSSKGAKYDRWLSPE